MSKTPEKLDWKQRCRKDETIVAKRRIWETKCGRYKVIHSVPKFKELSIVWYAIERLSNGNEKLISRHRVEQRAYDACHRHAGLEVKKTKKPKRRKRKT